MAINSVVFEGYVIPKSVDLRETSTGKKVLEFRVSQARDYTVGEETRTAFVHLGCKILGERGEKLSSWIAATIEGKNGPRGRHVILAGRLDERSWKNEDGETRSMQHLIVDEVTFCDRLPEQAGQERGQARSIPIAAPTPTAQRVAEEAKAEATPAKPTGRAKPKAAQAEKATPVAD